VACQTQQLPRLQQLPCYGSHCYRSVGTTARRNCCCQPEKVDNNFVTDLRARDSAAPLSVDLDKFSHDLFRLLVSVLQSMLC